jgi:predicted DNA-binding ribbon-helix-helix protein
MNTKKQKAFTFRAPAHLVDELKALADSNMTNMASLIRLAILNYLNQNKPLNKIINK